MKLPVTLNSTLAALVITTCYAHSQMTYPQSTSPNTCRLGGEPQFGVHDCAGPCDLRRIENGIAINFDSVDNPAAVFKRGQKVTIKYARNNHGPGGFVRLTLVPEDKVMDKKAHEKNAFYYSCWGANPVVAKDEELEKDKYGFSFIGSDGLQHKLAPGYYTTEVTIPAVVPDGGYVLGWVWFGGTGGSIVSNEPQEPIPWSYFSDYWSCSFVRIEGGDDLVSAYTPVFNNDMSQFSTNGCMAQNDAPGICSYEPCRGIRGVYQKPRPFKDGAIPEALTPEHFGGTSPTDPVPVATPVATPIAPDVTPVPEVSPEGVVKDAEFYLRKRSCRCIAKGERCSRRLAAKTDSYCMKKTAAQEQSSMCREACCEFCGMPGRASRRICQNESVKAVCEG